MGFATFFARQRDRIPHSIGLALFYISVLGVIGIIIPFWPVWLKARGLSGEEIGIILAFLHAAKVASNPVAAQVVDKSGRRRTVMGFLAVASLVSYIFMLGATSFWSLFVLTLLAGAFIAAIMPIGENLTMLIVYRDKLDYGQIRLWGSVSFMVCAAVAGGLLKYMPTEIILWLIIAGVLVTCLVTILIPEAETRSKKHAALPWSALFAQPVYLWFLLAASFMQSGHAVFYGFSTIHWQNHGITSAEVSGLWAIGVVAEIILFSRSTALTDKIEPHKLLLISGIGGVIRWTAYALTTNFAILAVMQVLHITTFACAHLAMLHFVIRALPASLTARGQSLYESVAMGAVLGLTMLFSGFLFDRFQGLSFFLGTGYCVIGIGVALIAGHKWNGEKLIEDHVTNTKLA